MKVLIIKAIDIDTEYDFKLAQLLLKNKLNWQPKISFQELVAKMVLSDLEEAKKDSLYQDKGFNVLNY